MTGEAVVAGAGMMAFVRHADRTLRPLAAEGICTVMWNGHRREPHARAVAQRTGYVVSSGSGSGPRPGLLLDYPSCGGEGSAALRRLGALIVPGRRKRLAIGRFSRLRYYPDTHGPTFF